jgi:single-strand DNA-binding protein
MATDMNKWIATGYLATAPQMAETPNGKTYARARVAIQRGWGEKKDSMFVTCQFWGKSGEYMMQYGEVGRRVLMEAKLNVVDKKDGKGNYSTSIFIDVNQFNLIDGNRSSGESSSQREEDPLEAAYGGSSYSADDDEDNVPFHHIPYGKQLEKLGAHTDSWAGTRSWRL